MIITKQCKECNQTKPITEFRLFKKAENIYAGHCKECAIILAKKRNEAHTLRYKRLEEYYEKMRIEDARQTEIRVTKRLTKRRAFLEKLRKNIRNIISIRPKTYKRPKFDIRYSKMWTETNNGFLEIYASLIGLEDSKVLLFGTKDAEAFKEGWNNHCKHLKK